MIRLYHSLRPLLDLTTRKKIWRALLIYRNNLVYYHAVVIKLYLFVWLKILYCGKPQIHFLLVHKPQLWKKLPKCCYSFRKRIKEVSNFCGKIRKFHGYLFYKMFDKILCFSAQAWNVTQVKSHKPMLLRFTLELYNKTWDSRSA